MQDLTRILGQLPIGVWVASVPSGEAVFTNEAFQWILGTGAPQSSRIGDAPETYGIFDRAGNLYPIEKLPFSRVLRTGEPVMVDDMVIRQPGGDKVNIRAFAHPLRAEGGRLTHVCVAFIDITREVQAEFERDRVAHQLALAVDHSPVAIWSIDSAGTITLSQGAGLASLGVKSGELIGQNVFELYEPYPEIIGHIRRGLAGESLQYESQAGEATFDTWITPIRSPAGDVIGITGLSHDISELRKLQAAGIQTDRTIALGTLAASVAHEINNPLTYILGTTDQISATIDELDAALAGKVPEAVLTKFAALRDDFSILRSGTERIATITRELRTFNHPDDTQTGPMDARSAVRSVLQLVGKELETRATVSLDLRATAPVLGHPARLVQVILNLVMNAMQSVPSQSDGSRQIHLRTETRGNQVIIEVSDSGTGVPAAHRERIFEPFFTTKSIGEGTGLGLFVCRNIVRGYGGEVTLHDRPGGGALFRISLPTSPEVAEPSTKSLPQAAPSSRGAQVLVIDDDLRVAAALCGFLTRAGHSARSIANADDGLRLLLADSTIDLVFCDLMMKGMTGMDLHARLVEVAPQLLHKVVFMTGGAYSPEARDFLLAHPDDVVEKPFDLPREVKRRLSRPG